MRVALVVLFVGVGCSRGGSDPFEGSARNRAAGPPPEATISAEATRNTAAVTVVAPAGYHINKDYPAKLHVDGAADVKMAKTDVTRAEAEVDDHRLRMPIAFEAGPGKHELRGTIAYAICNDDQTSCIPRTKPVTIAID